MNLRLMKNERAPLDIDPEWLWLERHPNASLDDSLARIAELEAVVARYEHAGKEPADVWRVELSVRRLFAQYRVVP